MKIRNILMTTVAFGAAAIATQPSFAQTQTPEEQEATSAADEGEGSQSIIVTGSRISRPNLESGAPITTVTGQEFFETGRISVGDILNEMPQLRATFSQQNSTRFLGTRGLNLLDLRGLGT